MAEDIEHDRKVLRIFVLITQTFINMKSILFSLFVVLFFCATPASTKKHGIKVLILCTGNTCRSQMAHGLLKSYGKDLAVYSGGVKAEERVNPKAVMVMRELGIDISDHKPCLIDEYLDEEWDYVITVCDNADKTCPAFNGKVKHRLHIPFEDPSKVTEGTYEFRLNEYRRIRDAINDTFFKLYCDMEERK